MSENSQFLRKETRVSTVVWSVICIIAIIMLTLLALMLNRREIAVVGSVVLALCLSFVHGITQLSATTAPLTAICRWTVSCTSA